jgi:hypothetical protein
MASASGAQTHPQRASDQRAARIAAAAVRASRISLGSPPPGYRQSPQDPTLHRQSLSANPRVPLWTEVNPRPGKYSSGRITIAKALGDACQQQGPNLLREVSSNFSPTARAPSTAIPSHLLLDGYIRGTTHDLRTVPGKHLHDSYLLGPPGSSQSSALQSVLNRSGGNHADGSSVILC